MNSVVNKTQLQKTKKKLTREQNESNKQIKQNERRQKKRKYDRRY